MCAENVKSEKATDGFETLEELKKWHDNEVKEMIELAVVENWSEEEIAESREDIEFEYEWWFNKIFDMDL